QSTSALKIRCPITFHRNHDANITPYTAVKTPSQNPSHESLFDPGITRGGTRIRCQTLMIQRLSVRRSKRPKIEGSGENSRNARKRLFVFAAGPKVSASKAIFPVAV